MATSGQTRILRHGTTRQRAEAILKNGPDPNFMEPGGLDRAEFFCCASIGGPFPGGTPEEYAERKARLFPNEGGAVVLELEVPVDIVVLATDQVGEVRFEAGYGLEELLQVWPALVKRILQP